MTPMIGIFHKTLQRSLSTNEDSMECHKGFAAVAHLRTE